MAVQAMKTSEYRSMSSQELEKNLLKLRRTGFSLRMQKASDQLAKSHLLQETRRDIARIKTLLGEREREQRAQTTSTQEHSA